MALYKYYSEKGKLVLDQLKVRITPPNEFNDPFEFSPIVKSSDYKKHSQDEVKKVLTKPDYFNSRRHLFRDRNFSAFQRRVRADIANFQSKYEKGLYNMDCEMQREMLDFLSAKFGIFCLTGDPCNPLMWAHYANSHKGLVIEFDDTHPLFKSEGFLKVDYNENRVSFDPTMKNNKEKVEEFVKRKSPHWHYEQEFRVIANLRYTELKVIEGHKMHFLRIEPTFIKAVVFGVRTSLELKQEIHRIVSQPKFSHVKEYQIGLDNRLFKLNLIEI